MDQPDQEKKKFKSTITFVKISEKKRKFRFEKNLQNRISTHEQKKLKQKININTDEFWPA